MKRYSISTHEIIAVAFLVGSFNFLSAILDFVAFSNFRFVDSIGYYGLALNVGNLVRDLYINNFVGRLVELPAYLLLFICLKVGRKWPYIALNGYRRNITCHLSFPHCLHTRERFANVSTANNYSRLQKGKSMSVISMFMYSYEGPCKNSQILVFLL